MALEPNRPAPPVPPHRNQSTFHINSDKNNNKKLLDNWAKPIFQPTVIRPNGVANNLLKAKKKAPPPRPAPPKLELLQQFNAANINGTEDTSLAAELEAFFGPSPQTSSKKSSSHFLAKSILTQSKKPKKPPAPVPNPAPIPKRHSSLLPITDSLIDLNSPVHHGAPIKLKHKMPAANIENKTLLDMDFFDEPKNRPSPILDLLTEDLPTHNGPTLDFKIPPPVPAGQAFRKAPAPPPGVENKLSNGGSKIDINQLMKLYTDGNGPHHNSVPDETSQVGSQNISSQIEEKYTWDDDPYDRSRESWEQNIITNESSTPVDVFESSGSAKLFEDIPVPNEPTDFTSSWPIENGYSEPCEFEPVDEREASKESLPEPQFPPPEPPTFAFTVDCAEEETSSNLTRGLCKAIYEFKGENPDELTFQAGDVIKLEGEINTDWWIGTFNGSRGMFPAGFVEMIPGNTQQGKESSGCFVVAIYPFEGDDDRDLVFKEGSVINVLSRINGDWLYGECNGKQGQFPASYVQKSNGTAPNKGTAHKPTKERAPQLFVALYSFAGEQPDDLTFNEGDRIVVTKEINEEWLLGKLAADSQGKQGMFPRQYVEKLGS